MTRLEAVQILKNISDDLLLEVDAANIATRLFNLAYDIRKNMDRDTVQS